MRPNAQNKLRSEDILKFYSTLKTAQPTSSMYFDFVESVLNAKKGKIIDRKKLLQQIDKLSQEGFFKDKLDPIIVELIKDDINQNGEHLKRIVQQSKNSNTASDLISSLQQTNDDSQYRLKVNEKLLQNHYQEGKKLANRGLFREAIIEFDKALEADKKIRIDKVHSSGQKTLSKILRKLSLALNEYAMRMTTKSNLSKEDFDEVMKKLDSAIYSLEQIPDAEKTHEDANRLALIQKNKALMQANLAVKFKQGKKTIDRDLNINLEPLRRPTPQAPQPGRLTPQGPRSDNPMSKPKPKVSAFSAFKHSKKQTKQTDVGPSNKLGPKKN